MASSQDSLDLAEQAFQRGNFALVRRLLRQAAQKPHDAAAAQRCAALWQRLRPDPLAAALIVICLVLYTTVIWATLH